MLRITQYMNTNRLPPLNALRAFESVSRHHQVTRAARELSVSPSAVSHLIRRLERDLEVPLVKRVGRNIALTEIGEKMAPELQEIFRSLSRVVGEVRTLVNQDLLTVSLRPYFAVKWLAPRLNRFWARHPDVELRLHHTNQPVDFRSENIDLAIEWSKGDRDGIRNFQLVPGELTPVFSPKLAGADRIQAPEDLLDFTLLRETDYDSWSDWFALFGKPPPNDTGSLHIDDSNVRNQAALDGQGIELSCRTLIRDDVTEGRLLAPFQESIGSFSYYLVEPVHSPLSRAAANFKNWILDEIGPGHPPVISR